MVKKKVLTTSIPVLKLKEPNSPCLDRHLPLVKGAKISSYRNCAKRLHIFSCGAEACVQWWTLQEKCDLPKRMKRDFFFLNTISWFIFSVNLQPSFFVLFDEHFKTQLKTNRIGNTYDVQVQWFLSFISEVRTEVSVCHSSHSLRIDSCVQKRQKYVLRNLSWSSLEQNYVLTCSCRCLAGAWNLPWKIVLLW